MDNSKMTEQQVKVLEGFRAFIKWSIACDRDFYFVLGNLSHDIGGLIREDEGFCPRTAGYVAKTTPDA